MRTLHLTAAAALVAGMIACQPGEEESGTRAEAAAGEPTAETGAAPADSTQVQADDRSRVVLPTSARPALREGMLTMLGSLRDATSALAEGDTARAARAAAASGMGNARMMPASVRQTAPGEFLTLGMRTHQAFDALGRQATGGAPADSLLGAVAEVLDACNECHQTYRVEWRHGSEPVD